MSRRERVRELRRQWVEALRSGKYAQTTAKMRGNHGYCCLGVLCDIVDPAGWGGNGGYDNPYHHRGCGGVPSREIMAAVDIRRDPTFLSVMNDRGATFAEIADYIEGRYAL